VQDEDTHVGVDTSEGVTSVGNDVADLDVLLRESDSFTEPIPKMLNVHARTYRRSCRKSGRVCQILQPTSAKESKSTFLPK
jgi:hypothetical protein